MIFGAPLIPEFLEYSHEHYTFLFKLLLLIKTVTFAFLLTLFRAQKNRKVDNFLMGRFISFRNYFANPLVCYLLLVVSVTIGWGMDVKNIFIASACFYLYAIHAVFLLVRFWDEIAIL